MKSSIKILLLTLVGASISLLSCEKEDADKAMEPVLLDCNSFTASNPNKISRLEDRGEGIDYIIDCAIVVDLDLTIDPGVTIAFTSSSGMNIRENGSLTAMGTSEKPITFTGKDQIKGSWRGIISYSDDVKNRLNHCVIEYAGGGSFNSNGDLGSLILWADAYFRIENTTISHGQSVGINMNYSRYNVELKNITITQCEGPVMTADPNILSKIEGASFTGNQTDAIIIGKPGGPALSGNHVWSDLGVPYRMANLLWVNGSTLKIEPGVTIEFENGTGIRVGNSDQSTLIAVGTPAKPIVFTGVTKVAGAWANIDFHFTKSPLNEISYAVIEYAGNSGSQGAVYMWAKPVVKVTHVAFKNIGTCAIYDSSYDWDPNPFLTESNNTLENVAGGYMCIN